MDNEIKIKSSNLVMRTTYFLLFLSLLITTVTAYLGSIQLKNGTGFMVTLLKHPIIISIVLVVSSIIFSIVSKFSATLSTIMFIIVTAIIGLTLSSISQIYSPKIIFQAVLSTAAVCGILTLVSFQTKYDMAKFSTQLFTMLLVIIVVSFVNMLFFHSRGLSLIISIVSTVVFAGWFMIDTQRLKNQLPTDHVFLASLQLAYALYLDVINLFMHILDILSYFTDNDN